MTRTTRSRASVRTALLGSAALAAMVAASGTAAAQSAAELQERVKALEAENRLMKRQMQEMKQQLDSLGGQASQKPVKAVERGQDDVTLKISGQVNRALLIGDDGTTGFVSHVDNDNSSTRIRFDAEGRVTDDFSVKSRIEVELQINPSNADPGGGGLQTNAGGAGGFNARKAYVAFNSKTFGQLTMGQESVATDGIVNADLSGTSVAISSDAEDFAGGVGFSNSANGNRVGLEIQDGFDDFDGAGQFGDRQTLVRYDSPRFLGFQLSGAHGVDGSDGNSQTVDVALRYGGTIWDTKVEAGIGYAHTDADRGASPSLADPNESFVGGSVGLLHQPTGLNVHYSQGKVMWEQDSPARPGPSFWYVKGGWIGTIFSMGKTAVAVEYGEYMNDDGPRLAGLTASDDNFGRVYGVALVQKIDEAATELYAGVRRYEMDIAAGTALDQNGQLIAGLEPVIAALVGVRTKF